MTLLSAAPACAAVLLCCTRTPSHPPPSTPSHHLTSHQIKGKVNAVSVDGCRRTGVVFDDVIAACELVNCAGVQVQCLGGVPTVSVDKCDGAQVFVPEAVAEGGAFQVCVGRGVVLCLYVLRASVLCALRFVFVVAGRPQSADTLRRGHNRRTNDTK